MSKHHKDSGAGHPADAGVHPQEKHPEAGAESGDGANHVAQLEAQLAEREKEIAELKDKYLRALADAENARKRIRQQSEETIRLQRESLLYELLPIVDNLERAVSAAQGGSDGGAILQGVGMVLRSLLDFLRANGVTPIVSVGQMFDPTRHEAVDHVESDSQPPNTVVHEFHRGYQIGERILRPARVSVAKGRDEEPEEYEGGGNGGAPDIETE
ncbi:MAG TPA: nucleotide exchange factor GrpE [Candidatus Binataceae bacterium]|nr:nucleotide exchange factor GrpE [Candidatus Binataceae bacterium]